MNRIYISHTDTVSVKEALEAVHVCLGSNVNPGETATLTNGLALYYNDKTKNPSFQVWRIANESE